MAEPHSLAALVTAARSRAGLSQRAAGEVTGVGSGHLSQIETGKIARPELALLGRLAGAYGIPLRDLATAAGREEEWSLVAAAITGTPAPPHPGPHPAPAGMRVDRSWEVTIGAQPGWPEAIAEAAGSSRLLRPDRLSVHFRQPHGDDVEPTSVWVHGWRVLRKGLSTWETLSAFWQPGDGTLPAWAAPAFQAALELVTKEVYGD